MAVHARTSRLRFPEALREAARFAEDLGVASAQTAHAREAALLVAECEADLELAVAAQLHDIAEHQIDDERLNAVRSSYGDRVARVVAWCADNGTHPLPPFRGLDEFRVAELLCATRDVVVVAAADTAVAVRALTDRLSSGPVDAVASPQTAAATAWFLSEVAAMVGHRLRGHALATMLDAAVASLCNRLRAAATLSAAG